MKYPIFEHFKAFQGEGVHMGRSAYFIRTYACDQHCPWCDSAGTWHKDYRPARVQALTGNQVAELVDAQPPTFVVLTGGEPTLYDCRPLVDACHARQFRVHLETAGHLPIRGNFDWITLSPKPFGKPPLINNVKRADEFKIIVDSKQALLDGLEAIGDRKIKSTVWLHPEWSKRNDPEILTLIAEVARDYPDLRAGYQLHKLYMVDKLDPHSDKRAIPLGGNPSLGSST